MKTRFLWPVMASFVAVTTHPVFAQSGNSRRSKDQGADLACCGACAVPFIVAATLLVLNVCLLVWVARDAKNRGMDSSVIWMLLVLFTGLIGLIIYLLSRPAGEITRCAYCGNGRMVSSRICPHCHNQ